jgi:hypothetical protein
VKVLVAALPRCAFVVVLRLLAFAGLEVFPSSPFQTGLLFRPVDATFFEDFVLRRHISL